MSGSVEQEFYSVYPIKIWIIGCSFSEDNFYARPMVNSTLDIERKTMKPFGTNQYLQVRLNMEDRDLEITTTFCVKSPKWGLLTKIVHHSEFARFGNCNTAPSSKELNGRLVVFLMTERNIRRKD